MPLRIFKINENLNLPSSDHGLRPKSIVPSDQWRFKESIPQRRIPTSRSTGGPLETKVKITELK